jgi:hypothetical protein
MSMALPRPLASALLLATIACSTSETNLTGPSGNKCAVAVTSSMTSAPAAGGSGTLALATARECTWAASSGAGWVVITSSTSGQGEGEISFRVAANRDPAPRQATIEVNDAKTSISQAPAECSFNVSPRTASVGPQGGNLPIQVELSANCPWSASSPSDWLRVASGSSGTGAGTVMLAVDANPGAERAAVAMVAGIAVSITQTTSASPAPPPPVQPNCSYAIQPAGQTMAAAGGSGTFAVTASASCSWTAVSNTPWITITAGAAGTGNGSVSFAVGSGGSRSGTISVAGQTFTVTQGAAACNYSISPSSQSMPAPGGNVTVSVTAGGTCAWASGSNASWITIADGASGSGNGQTLLTVAANTGPARSGTVTIAGQSFTVLQAAAACTYTLTPPVVENVEAAGRADITIAVAAAPGCTWTAVSNDQWITVTGGTSGSGGGSVVFTVAANMGAARGGSITIGGQTLTVGQQAAPCAYGIAAASQNMPPEAGEGSVAVTAAGGCAWSAVSHNTDWLTITTGAAGNGNGTVVFAVTANGTGAGRAGTMTVAGHTFMVTQDAPCTYSLSATTFPIGAAGGPGAVTVTAGPTCAWTATVKTGASWLTVTGTSSGTGNGTVNFRAAANSAGQPRTGTIAIGTQVLTVEQGAP